MNLTDRMTQFLADTATVKRVPRGARLELSAEDRAEWTLPATVQTPGRFVVDATTKTHYHTHRDRLDVDALFAGDALDPSVDVAHAVFLAELAAQAGTDTADITRRCIELARRLVRHTHTFGE